MAWPAALRAWLDIHWWVPLIAVAPLAGWVLWSEVRHDKRL